MDTELGPININLWDTAGQERYQSLVPMYSKSSSVAIFVFDQSEKINFQALDDMIARAKRDTPEDCEIILVGNKSDLDYGINQDAVQEWASAKSLKLLFVSAKTGKRINDLFEAVVESIIQKMKKPKAEEPSTYLRENNNNNSCC